MRFPPFFKDLPNDAVRRVVELLNQPQLVQTVKEAAQQVGATTEWGASQLQDSLQQAKRWIDSVSGRWTAQAPRATTPLVNATGEIFSSKWSSPALNDRAAAAYSRAASGYVDDAAIRDEAEKILMDATGAESALVVHNMATAILCAAIHPEASDGWLIPRAAAIRLHDGGDVLSILHRFGRVTEVGAVNSCSTDDVNAAITGGKQGLFSVAPSLLSDEASDIHGCDLMLTQSKTKGLPCVEARFDGSLCDLQSIVPMSMPIAQRLRAGVTAVMVPGDALLGGPRCGIVVGRSSFIDPMRELARTMGFAASSIVHAILLGVLPSNASADAWEQLPTGAAFTSSLDNQRQRANRIAEQLRGAKTVSSVEVSEMNIAIGSAPWSQTKLPSIVISVAPSGDLSELVNRLRCHERSVLTRLGNGCVQISMRTIDPADDRTVVAAFGLYAENGAEQPAEASQTN